MVAVAVVVVAAAVFFDQQIELWKPNNFCSTKL
jgi:hypothetical protein